MDIFRRKKFDEAMFAKNRTLAIRVGQYQSSDIKEASFDYGYIKGDVYKPGGTCAGSAKIVFTSIITTFNKLDKIYPEIGLLVDGTYEWVKMGEYFINDIEIDRNRKTTKLDLMDGMFKLNREHVTDLTYPAEIRHVIKEICLKTGVKLANENMDITSMNYVIEKIPKEKKMTFRDVLSLATQMLGMSCFFNREGKLEIKELNDSGITITADSYFMHGLTKSEVEYQIAGITCKKDKETLTVGMRTGRSLELDNLFMSQAILDNLYHKIKDIRYYPFNLNYQGHLLLNVGEWVTIKTNTGETFKSPVLSQSFIFKGGLRGRISADSKAGNDAQYSYAGTLTKKIVQFNEFEAQIQNQIEEVDKGFDQTVAKIKKDFSDQVELAKAKTEEVKRQLSDTIDQRLNSFNSGPLQEVKHRAEEALRNAGASSLLAQEAKRIALDSTAKLEEFKRQATSAQTALSGDLDALKRTVANEVNQASEYRRTTTEALSRMTGQMDGFATKSEVKQGIDGLTQTFAKMKVGGRNYIRHYDFDGLLPLSGSFPTWNYERLADPASKSGYMLKATCTQAGNGGFHKVFFDLRADEFQGKDMTWSLDIKSSRPVTFYAMGFEAGGLKKNVPVSTEWERITNTFKVAFKQYYSCVFYANGWQVGDVVYIRDPQLEEGTVATTPRPAPEDGKDELLAARTEFKKTADGLSAKMSAVENYVGQDGQRQEALKRYSREESARQATAVRELVTRDYVGKATHQEDVRAIERKFEAITNPQNGTIVTQIAKYKNAVDGRFADITSMISGKANQTDFQRVKETSQLYERILGNTNNSIVDNVARMALTNQLFQVEVSKYANVGGPNMLRNSRADDALKHWTEDNGRLGFTAHSFYFNGQKRMFELRPGAVVKSNRFLVKRNADYILNILGFDNNSKYFRVYFCKRKKDSSMNFQQKQLVFDGKTRWVDGSVFDNSRAVKKTFKFNVGDYDDGYLQFEYDRNNPDKWGGLFMTELDFYEGTTDRLWQPAPEDAVADANAKLEATQTKMTQLAGSWAVQNINSAGDLISGLNLGANGHNRLSGKLTHITGETLIDKAVIKSAMIDKLKTANFEAGSVTTVVLDAEAVTAEKIKVDQALFNKLVANEAYLSQLFAKQAFINRVQSVAIDASQVRSGILSGDRIYGGTIRGANIFGGTLTGHTQIKLGSYGSFDTVNGGLQINVPRDYNAKDGLGVQFIGSYGRGENVPYGLFVYKDSDFTVGNTATGTDEFIMTVEGYIKAKGVGWLKTGLGKVGSVSTGTLAFWKSTVALDFAPNDIYYTYGGQAYGLWAIIKQNFSDKRLKENIVDCEHKALDYIQHFQFKEYDWKKQEDRSRQAHTKIGLIAQEVQEVDPTLVYENGDTLNLDNLRLTNIALKAIQEMALENKKLTQRLENLENERRTA